jgi:hypothetical protein
MAVLPAMNPASAAPIMSDFIDFVIADFSSTGFVGRPDSQILTLALSYIRAKHSVGFPALRELFFSGSQLFFE